MTRLAMVTTCTGELYRQIAELTHPTFQKYAKKIGADLIVWDSIGKHTNAGYQKLEIAELLEKYDRVLYLDSDIIIRPDAPSIFDLVPETHIGMFNEGHIVDRMPAKRKFMPDQPDFWQDPVYFNTGVMVVSKQHRSLFTTPIKEVDNFYEQTYLNFNIYRFNLPVHHLTHRWNRLLMTCKMTGEDRLDSYFLHYAGQFCHTGPEVINMTLQTIATDLECWANDEAADTFFYPRKIFIQTGGGIGDVVSMEPVVRYMVEHLYRHDDITIKTDCVEVFQHLTSRAKVVHLQEVVRDDGHYEIYLMPKEDKLVTNFITHSLCHPLVHAGIVAFRGQMRGDKTIKLVTTNTMDGVIPSRSVVVHPGRGWPSKTFPSSWWQAVIDGIVKADVPVVLIGKTFEDGWRGMVDVDGSRCIDLRDKTNLQDLINVISLGRVLLSNDSAPVHIAGAFDNWIGLLSTCKPSEHVLPFRCGTQSYRASDLATGIIHRPCEPNQIGMVRLDECTEKELMDCLPRPELVISWALARLEGEQNELH